jgi:monoamine oxidase
MKRREALSLLTVGASGMFIPWHGAQASGATLQGYLRTNWSRDPYSFGSYSYVAKGARQKDRIVLGASIDRRVYFAGEAVHPKQNSTVHAAYESGVMTAKDVARETSGRIAVIGAGVSGLVAAQTLSKTGRSVTIFEARDRIGGRIRTNTALGAPLDLGASWIHGTRNNPITKLASAAGAATVATDETYIVRGSQGRVISDRDTPDWLENVTTIQQNAGADISEINLRAYHSEPEYGGDEVIFPDGYNSIFPALSGDYKIRLSQTVSSISHNAKGVTITANGKDNKFDVVIVTLPLGVLKRNAVQFIPALPSEKRKAILRLGMGTLDKLYLLYDRPFWDKDITWIITAENGLSQGQFNQWLNLYKYLGLPIIMAFNGGPPALQLSQKPDEQIVRLAQHTLQNTYG